MIINQSALQGIYTGFKTIFTKAFGEIKPLHPRVATVVPSEAGEEAYKWLGALPMMREWVGERNIQNLSASDYTIKNKDFELTVSVPRNDIEDDKIGLYSVPIQMLANRAAQHPDSLVFKLLKDGFTEKCYDGKPFFATDHKMGKKTASNAGTAALSLDSYIAARSAIMSVTDDGGTPLGLLPDLLVVPPALEAKAREILKAELIGGSTNTMKDTAEPLVIPELAGKDTAWYLLCTSLPVKPLIYQERKKAKFVSLTGENDVNVFMRKKYLYGCDSRGNAGFGFWQMAYGSTGAA
ncbi:Mu-like prophage major head subunit gpT family protein [Oscillospiraceae bacterium OttesenSCG-928-F05]|nr:Mu-like prophage major head subunit gpT family protein [Oscillospiraceae bacterium OttesenSCG-928-F05]